MQSRTSSEQSSTPVVIEILLLLLQLSGSNFRVLLGSDLALEDEWFDEDSFVSQHRPLGPSVLLVVDDPRLEEYVQIAADDADVAIDPASEVPNRLGLPGRDLLDEFGAFLRERSFRGLALEDQYVVQFGFPEAFQEFDA